MLKNIKKWLAIVLFGFSVFVAGYNFIMMVIAPVQEEYAKAIWLLIGTLSSIYWIYITYRWYSKNK